MHAPLELPSTTQGPNAITLMKPCNHNFVSVLPHHRALEDLLRHGDEAMQHLQAPATHCIHHSRVGNCSDDCLFMITFFM